MKKSGPVPQATDLAAASDHPLVGQLRDILASPATSDLGSLAALLQQLYAEMRIVGGAVAGEPDAGGGAAPAHAAKGRVEAIRAERDIDTLQHHLHTSEQHFSDGNFPF